MSSTYGPYALTAGQRQAVNLGGTPGTIRISNQSTSLDLFVSFQQVPPTSSVAGGDWDLVVHAGWAESVPLTDESLTPYALGKAWQGYLWVMPISNSAQLAQNGTVPSLANVYVTTYEPGEPAPNSSSPGPIAVASTSQQRVIAVPVVPDVQWAGTIGTVAVGASAQLTQLARQIADPGVANRSGQIFPLLYGLTLEPFGGSDYDDTVNVQVSVEDSGGVVRVAQTTIFSTVLWNFGTPKTRNNARWQGAQPLTTNQPLAMDIGFSYPWMVRWWVNVSGGSGSLSGAAIAIQVSFVNPLGLWAGLVPPIAGGISRNVVTQFVGNSTPIF